MHQCTLVIQVDVTVQQCTVALQVDICIDSECTVALQVEIWGKSVIASAALGAHSASLARDVSRCCVTYMAYKQMGTRVQIYYRSVAIKKCNISSSD